MLREVETVHLVFFGDAQTHGGFESHKEARAYRRGPDECRASANRLRGELRPTEATYVEYRGSKGPPDATETVDAERSNRIIELESIKKVDT